VGFAIDENPFFLLRASPRDGRERLADLADAAVEDGRLARPAAQALVRTLTASRPRLEAELAWFPGMAPAAARQAADLTVARDIAQALKLVGDAPTIGRLNIAAHSCAAGQIEAFPVWVETVSAGIDPKRLAEAIRADRVAAKFPVPPEQEVADGRDALMRGQADAVAAMLVGEAKGAAVLASAVGGVVAAAAVPPALDDVLDRWDAANLRNLATITDELERHVATLMRTPRDWSALSRIRALTGRASVVTAPRRAREARAGIDAPAARRIAAKVRALATDMDEKHQAPDLAHTVTAQLVEAFPDLPEFSTWLRNDLQAYERSKQALADNDALRPLTEVIAESRRSPLVLADGIDTGNLRDRGRGLAGRLYAAFVAAAMDNGRLKGDRDAPWHMVRELAIELHNTHKRTHAGLLLARMMVGRPAVGTEVRERLTEDVALLERLYETNAAIEEAKGGRFGAALARIEVALRLATAARDRKELLEMHAAVATRRREQVAKRWAYGVIAAVVLGIFVANQKPSPPPAAPGTLTSPRSGPIESGAMVLSLPRDASLVQQRLRDLGFYDGPIDGVFGRQSREALANFQWNQGLLANGELSISTHQLLFRGTGR
jgi:hypothetical protein